jgi:AraC-like DNA-binding protein
VELSHDTRAFIAETFDSVESIEIVLLLRRSPNTYWTAKAISDVLGMREELVARRLSALEAARLLRHGQSSGAFRYDPADSGLTERMDGLAEAYAGRRADVMNVIYSANLERLRAFSDAFRLSK